MQILFYLKIIVAIISELGWQLERNDEKGFEWEEESLIPAIHRIFDHCRPISTP